MVLVKDIDETVNMRSLMPDGLADTLTRGELVDLVRFLSELGKVGPYSLGKAGLFAAGKRSSRPVRVWPI